MIKEVNRQYLEIKNLNTFSAVKKPSDQCEVSVIKEPDFQLNKFFYRQIGKKHRWIDRLSWNDSQWINYLNNPNVNTYVLKEGKDLIGYFEQIYEKYKKETEIAYFGILESYYGKKYGGFLLSEAIKNSFEKGSLRVWLHTCSLDHENALKNYLARGMIIFHSEKTSIEI